MLSHDCTLLVELVDGSGFTLTSLLGVDGSFLATFVVLLAPAVSVLDLVLDAAGFLLAVLEPLFARFSATSTATKSGKFHTFLPDNNNQNNQRNK